MKQQIMDKAMTRLLRKHRITGWSSRRANALPGHPSFAFPDAKVVVFIDGCLLHGCPLHAIPARNRTRRYDSLIRRTQLGDQAIRRRLNRMGWSVVRVWEHTLKRSPHRAVTRVQAAINKSETGR